MQYILLFLSIILVHFSANAQICPYKPCMVTDEKTMQKCFDSAAPGTIINVNPMYNYKGKYKIEGRKGTTNCPIFFNGNGAVIIGTEKEEKEVCLTMNMAEYWIMADLEIRNCQTGMKMEQCSFNTINKFEIHDSERIGLHVKGGKTNSLAAFDIHDLGNWEWPWGLGSVFEEDQLTIATGMKFGPKVLDYAVKIKPTSAQGKFTGLIANGIDRVSDICGAGWTVALAGGTSSNGQGNLGGMSVGGIGNGAVGNAVVIMPGAKGDVSGSGGSVQVTQGSGNHNCASSMMIGGDEDPDNLSMPC